MISITRLTARAVVAIVALCVTPAGAQTPPPPTPPVQSPPVPLPFPGVKPPPGPTVDPSLQAAAEGEQMIGNAPVYPAAEFLEEFDAGRGQRYYIYGTNLPYQDIVDYYKARLRDGGRKIFDTPAVQRFDLGRFDERTMAFPPSISVKDYGWSGSEGYLVVNGTTERRYRTIIQIVPGAGG